MYKDYLVKFLRPAQVIEWVAQHYNEELVKQAVCVMPATSAEDARSVFTELGCVVLSVRRI